MRVLQVLLAISFVVTPALAASGPQPAQLTVAKDPPAGDPFLWLENKDGARALSWVRAQNARTLPILEHDPHYAAFDAQALAILQSKDRIADPDTVRGDVFNFWQDAAHARGIWRRTSLQSYRSTSPAWTTVLDLDALAKRERANWVFEGADCAQPQERYCILSLSDGGEDAVTDREFDLATRRFVTGGFVLPREKQNTAWIDPDSLLVARAWEPGQVTTSGYPYVVKRLRRGQPLSSAVEVFRGAKSDVGVSPVALYDGRGNEAVLINRGVSFFESRIYLFTPAGLRRLDLPLKNQLQGLVDGRLLFTIDQDWTAGGRSFKQGSVLAVNLAEAKADPSHLHPALVYAPGPRDALNSVAVTKDDVILTILHNVRGQAFVYTPAGASEWSKRSLNLPGDSTIDVTDTSLHDDHVFFTVQSFLTPDTLYLADAASGSIESVKQLPAEFDASNDVVEQHEATSKDGTKIPYFIIHPANMRYDYSNPTVLYAYGGFELSQTPYYSATTGRLWLERGGVYVLANIRGGGEFGPAWHEAGLKTHRQRIYDDFYAVGKDLIARKITAPRHLGIVGGSNGGLLMGVEFTQHPDMWNAVVMQVPLLDMLRYEKIQAGASWVGEYGSVSVPAERAFLAKISPYQNLRGGVAYPEPFLWTTTKDDRVGPQHARKFAAKLAAMHVPYLFYEVTEGGHGAGANSKEDAKTIALQWTYFTMKL
jgi:prolyl oligopeptidase